MIPRREFQQAITRLSKLTVGPKEASALFAIGDGATVSEIADRSLSDRATTHIRLGMLRQKGLVRSSDRCGGLIVYRLTRAGLDIVTSTLGSHEQTDLHPTR